MNRLFFLLLFFWLWLFINLLHVFFFILFSSRGILWTTARVNVKCNLFKGRLFFSPLLIYIWIMNKALNGHQVQYVFCRLLLDTLMEDIFWCVFIGSMCVCVCVCTAEMSIDSLSRLLLKSIKNQIWIHSLFICLSVLNGSKINLHWVAKEKAIKSKRNHEIGRAPSEGRKWRGKLK